MTISTSVTSVLDKLRSFDSFVWQATKIAPIALIWYLVGWSLWNTGTVVDPIGIPKRIEEMGFSSTGLASSLAAEIREIQESDGRKKYRQEIKAAEKQQDIQVPGLPIPLHSALDMVRKALGLQEQRISGEIIEEDGRLVLLLAGGRAEPVSLPIGNDRGLAMRTLIQKGAQEAMSTTDCAGTGEMVIPGGSRGQRPVRRNAPDHRTLPEEFGSRRRPRDVDPAAHGAGPGKRRARESRRRRKAFRPRPGNQRQSERRRSDGRLSAKIGERGRSWAIDHAYVL